MQLKILGCSGGIGAELRTTSILVDQDVLIDCGTGVGDLSIEALQQIRHLFLTHSHLDHIAYLPLLVDSCFETLLGQPLKVYLQQGTADALMQHIFNGQIWPDFTSLPSVGQAVLELQIISPGDLITLADRVFEPIAVAHTVPALGYRVETWAGKAFAFSGDTGSCDSFWQVLNRHPRLDLLLIECAYSNRESVLAGKAAHYCPKTLLIDLAKLHHQPEIFISHLKVGGEAEIMADLSQGAGKLKLDYLTRGRVFYL